MKNIFIAIATICVVGLSGCCSTATTSLDDCPPIDRSLTPTPPMGWNSWDCWGWSVDEQTVRANAKYMADNFKELGYEYIVIDQGWFADEEAIQFEPFVQETMTTTPTYNLDEYGRLLPDTLRFPSSRDGAGFKPLADYIHSLGLKFGVHLLRGMPWEAYAKNMPILGSDQRAQSVGQPDNGCVWYDGFYGVDMTKPGSQEYYNSVFKLFAEWGLDFVKVDDLVNQEELLAVSRASRLCGRDIVLSVVPAGIPQEVLRENAHMARTGADFWDSWEMLRRNFPVAADMVDNSGDGFWLDMDMLPIGKIGYNVSVKGAPRWSNYTEDELYTLFSLFYIAQNPLMIGGNMIEPDPVTESLILNKEALSVHKLAVNAKQVRARNAHVTWVADVKDSDDKFVALFNQWDTLDPIRLEVTAELMGFPEGTEFTVRDLWAHEDLGSFTNSFVEYVNKHGARLFRVSKVK